MSPRGLRAARGGARPKGTQGYPPGTTSSAGPNVPCLVGPAGLGGQPASTGVAHRVRARVEDAIRGGKTPGPSRAPAEHHGGPGGTSGCAWRGPVLLRNSPGGLRPTPTTADVADQTDGVIFETIGALGDIPAGGVRVNEAQNLAASRRRRSPLDAVAAAVLTRAPVTVLSRPAVSAKYLTEITEQVEDAIDTRTSGVMPVRQWGQANNNRGHGQLSRQPWTASLRDAAEYGAQDRAQPAHLQPAASGRASLRTLDGDFITTIPGCCACAPGWDPAGAPRASRMSARSPAAAPGPAVRAAGPAA